MLTQCKGASYLMYNDDDVSSKDLYMYVYPNPMLLFMDNSDSTSIVEQLSQGPSFSYNTFISDSFLAL